VQSRLQGPGSNAIFSASGLHPCYYKFGRLPRESDETETDYNLRDHANTQKENERHLTLQGVPGHFTAMNKIFYNYAFHP
jgi:hypothetical protein